LESRLIRQFNDTLKAQSDLPNTLVDGIMQLAPSDFSGQHLKKGGTLTVLFAAEWCPFCRRFRPVFDSVLAKKGVQGALADLSDLENPLWEAFSIEVVPTVMVFKEGVVVYRKDGILGQGLPENAMDEVVPLLPTGREAAS
jgi:thioredoxin 1